MGLYARSDIRTELADKYAVRDYVQRTIGAQYLIPLLGVYRHASQIDFDSLPNAFVCKATHGSGWTIICRDKNKLDIAGTREQLDKWLKDNYYYYYYREWHYKNIPPRCICEEFIQTDNGEPPWDYKIFCFNGKAHLIEVDVNRFTQHTDSFFDLKWQKLPMQKGDPTYPGTIPKPDRFDEMIQVAQELSRGFNMVRVDLYYAKRKIYFGEMTFTPENGLHAISPEEYDYRLGELFDLPVSGNDRSYKGRSR